MTKRSNIIADAVCAFFAGLIVVGFVETFRAAIAIYAAWPIQIIGTAAVVAIVLGSFFRGGRT